MIRMAASLLIFSVPAFAQLTNAETIAGLSGRIIGAAKACGVDGNRLAKTAEKVFAVVKVRARSDKEEGAAVMLFVDAINAGGSEVTSGRSSCREARSAFSEMERKVDRQ